MLRELLHRRDPTKFAIQFAYLRCIIKICSLFGVRVCTCEWENPSHFKYNILEMIAVFSSVCFSLLLSFVSNCNWVRSLLFIELCRSCFSSVHTKYRTVMDLIEISFNALQWCSNKFTQIKRVLQRTQHTFSHLHRNWFKSLERVGYDTLWERTSSATAETFCKLYFAYDFVGLTSLDQGAPRSTQIANDQTHSHHFRFLV